MGKPDRLYVNTQDDSELDDWLRRNSYRGTKENRVLLVSIIPIVKTHYAKESIQNLLWTELDEFRENFTGKFFELEK